MTKEFEEELEKIAFGELVRAVVNGNSIAVESGTHRGRAANAYGLSAFDVVAWNAQMYVDAYMKRRALPADERLKPPGITRNPATT